MADLIARVADALAEYDYPGGPDEVERAARLEQARAAVGAVEEAIGAEPVTGSAAWHAERAQRILDACVDADGTPPLEPGQETAWRVQALQVAEIHARLAHALTAAAMVQRPAPPPPAASDPLDYLKRLVAAAERLAGAVDRGAILVQRRG